MKGRERTTFYDGHVLVVPRKVCFILVKRALAQCIHLFYIIKSKTNLKTFFALTDIWNISSDRSTCEKQFKSFSTPKVARWKIPHL